MSGTLQTSTDVSSENVRSMTQEVWSALLGLELTPAPLEAALPVGPVLVAAVQISGAWQGTVQIECSHDHATAAAALMFASEAEAMSDEQTRDALGELANVLTGNVKSLLPGPSALSVPVSGSAVGHQQQNATCLVHRLGFVAASGGLHVSIWKAEVS